jgi:GDPmannose 4,6-dehydratase
MQWLRLQQPGPEDYVIATGQQYTVTHFVNAVAESLGTDLRWIRIQVSKKGCDSTGRCVVVDSRYFRPAKVELFSGTPARRP